MRFLDFFTFKRRLEIEGIMPWRALLRLKNARIPTYQVKKIEKNRLVLLVNAKDIKKVFAIFKQMCYNNNTTQNFPTLSTASYQVRDLGGVGLEKTAEFFKKRTAFVLGALLFCVGTLFVQPFVFGVRIVGTEIYKREIYQTLEANGVRPFSKYDQETQSEVTAKLLSLDGVEFCSVQKQGYCVVVEMRLSPFTKPKAKNCDMLALRSGKILSLVVLRGTPMKKVGEEIQAGEKIVAGGFQTPSGEFKGVAPIARVHIACAYKEILQTNSQEEAFATAYLKLSLGENDKIISKKITPVGTGETTAFQVEMEYIFVQTVNF